MTLKEEMAKADLDMRKKAKRSLKRKFPDITEVELQAFLNEAVPLIIKAIYKSDTRAATKIMNMAYGKPK